MEERFTYSFLLPLQEITQRRLIVDLWTAPDVLSAIETFIEDGEFRFKNSHKWQYTIESKVADKLSKLVLPKSLKTKMLFYVTPIGLEIKWWKSYHEGYLEMCKFDTSVLDKLCWTPAGAVDYRKTAEEIIRFKLLDTDNLYCLACLYCLEDYIPALWNQLPNSKKMKFLIKKNTNETSLLQLTYCWPYILKIEQTVLNGVINPVEIPSFNVDTFLSSASSGNKAAAEYFWQRMSPEEKETLLLKTARFLVSMRNNGFYVNDFPPVKLSEVLCYLISLMNLKQQSEFFKSSTWKLLMCFFDWPCQDYFLKIADLLDISSRFHSGNLFFCFQIFVMEYGYYPPLLLQEIFIQSSLDVRKAFVNRECRLGYIFPQIFKNEDSETVEVIFKNVDLSDRRKLVSCEKVFELFYDYIRRNRWHMVEVCLREATLTKIDGLRLKRKFSVFLKRSDKVTKNGNIIFRRLRMKQFLRLVDKVSPSARSKRSLTSETINEGKKFCSNK